VKTAIDSNILSAVFNLEPTSAELIEKLGELHSKGELVICGAVYAEVHAIPRMTRALLDEFLEDTGITVEPQLALSDWGAVGQTFAEYAKRRRKHGDGQGKRLLADFIVGAHALMHCEQLLTLDPERYETNFPKLKLFGLES
jgi:predicted nucleic acid-binding protein